MTSFWLAMQFLTRFPTPRIDSISDQAWGQATLFFPVIGLLIGTGLYLLAAGFQSAGAWLLASVLLLAWVLLTGALHLDGLADSADAWIGGHGDSERTLAIMKDPYAGPAGISAIVLVLLTKYAALGTLLNAHPLGGWWLAPLLGRSAVLALLLTMPYVRAQGLGAAMSDCLPRKHAVWALAAVALLVMWVLGWNGLQLLLVLVALGAYLRWGMLRRIGGTTGDTLGATVELVEMTTLLVLALSLPQQG